MADRPRSLAESRGSSRATGLALMLILLPLLPTQALGQGVLGEILDKETGGPVATVQVELVDAEGQVVGQALSDPEGLFFIPSGLGTYSLVVSRLGYAPINVGDVEVTESSVFSVRIRLSPDAVELPGLVVQGERPVRYLDVNGFYKRQRMGFGHHLEVERERQLVTLEPSDFIRRLPGVVVRGGRVRSTRRTFRRGHTGNCLLQLLVDGMYRGVDLDEVLVLWNIEAIEVYNGVSNVPAQWQALANMGYLTPAGALIPTCGIVVVWTKH